MTAGRYPVNPKGAVRSDDRTAPSLSCGSGCVDVPDPGRGGVDPAVGDDEGVGSVHLADVDALAGDLFHPADVAGGAARAVVTGLEDREAVDSRGGADRPAVCRRRRGQVAGVAEGVRVHAGELVEAVERVEHA